MEREEIQLAQEKLAELFEAYMKQVFKEGKNKNIKFAEFIEKPMYLAAMRHCNSNQSAAGRCLGISLTKVRKRLLKYFNTAKVGGRFSEVA